MHPEFSCLDDTLIPYPSPICHQLNVSACVFVVGDNAHQRWPNMRMAGGFCMWNMLFFLFMCDLCLCVCQSSMMFRSESKVFRSSVAGNAMAAEINAAT